MNKNKIIFAIIGGILLIGMIFVILNLNKSGKDNRVKAATTGNFNIWIVGDKKEDANKVIETFKKVNPEYASSTIIIESFKSYEDYYFALTSAIILDKAPDLFVLNNNEKESIFSSQTTGIDSSVISPNDFRKKYKGFMGDDLIITLGEGEEKKEYLVGIPVGYETLGIFYNKRYIKSFDLGTLSGLNNLIVKLKDNKDSIVPIGIGNGSTVYGVSDIITQFFMLEDGISSIGDVIGSKMKQGLSSYFLYGTDEGNNYYNSRFLELNNMGNTSVDLFSDGGTYMLVGYPRLLNDIKFSKNFLSAVPFPHYYSGQGKTLVNYDYFVLNKDSKNPDLANAFLSYLSTDIGANDYLNIFSYYLPGLLSLESDKLEEKVNDKFNIVLSDFYSDDYEFSSFDKGIKTIYDKNIVGILDNTANYEKEFETFRNTIICKTKQMLTLEGLSKSCE